MARGTGKTYVGYQMTQSDMSGLQTGFECISAVTANMLRVNAKYAKRMPGKPIRQPIVSMQS